MHDPHNPWAIRIYHHSLDQWFASFWVLEAHLQITKYLVGLPVVLPVFILHLYLLVQYRNIWIPVIGYTEVELQMCQLIYLHFNDLIHLKFSLRHFMDYYEKKWLL